MNGKKRVIVKGIPVTDTVESVSLGQRRVIKYRNGDEYYDTGLTAGNAGVLVKKES